MNHSSENYIFDASDLEWDPVVGCSGLWGRLFPHEGYPQEPGRWISTDGLHRLSIGQWSPNPSGDREYCHRCDFTHDGDCEERNRHDWRVAPRQFRSPTPFEGGSVDLADPESENDEEAFHLFLRQRAYCGVRINVKPRKRS